MKCRVGTSGWNYDDFTGVLYEKKTKSRDRLAEYSGKFQCVEINSTFYRIFKKSVFEKWAERTPPGFIFTAKLNHLLDELTNWFFGNISGLGKKLKVILIQLPPKLKFDEKKANAFLMKIRGSAPCPLTIEPRHPSWFTDTFYKIIRKMRIPLCIADTGGKYPTEFLVTGGFSYARLHGPKKLYASRYTLNQLKNWKEKIEKLKRRENYIFFDNTFSGFAVKNALQFKRLCNS